MTWVKLDDGFADHPKVIGLSDKAFRVYVRTLCYCARFSPGIGLIPRAVLTQLGATKAVAAEPEAVRLWDRDDEGDLYIHDFADYHPKQPTREQRQEAGKRGGLARAANASKSQAEPKQLASSLLDGNPRSRVDARPDPVPSRPVPERDPSDEGSLSASEREMVETILSKIPSPQKHDPLTREECEQFARDFPGMFGELASPIAKVRQEGKFAYPSNLRRHMPGWQDRSTPNGNNRTHPAGYDPALELALEASGRHIRA